MLTRKEILSLNFIYKKLKGNHKNYTDLKKFLMDGLNLKEDQAFELAYLYDKNFEEANGDFSNVKEPKRMTLEEFMDTIPWQIKAVMHITGDETFEEYELVYDDMVAYDGKEYRIFESDSDLTDYVINSDLGYLCDDPGDWGGDFVSMSVSDRETYAEEEAQSRVDDMDDEQIINDMGIYGDLEQIKNDGGEDVEERQESLITKTREELVEKIKDEIYDELDNPVDYFVNNNGIFNDISDLIRNGPVNFDCDDYIDSYIDGMDIDSLMSMAGYSRWDEVRSFEKGYVYIGWD